VFEDSQTTLNEELDKAKEDFVKAGEKVTDS
jgi:hypothetical protein